MGDSTILANRSVYVDFTATYTDLGVGTLARIKKNDKWFFLQPMELRLWITTISSLFYTVFVVWAVERMNPNSDQKIGTVFWTILLTIFFAQSSISLFLSEMLIFTL